MSGKTIIARNLKILRNANGYTQERVAEYLGIERSAYANYEAAVREIPLLIIQKLADLFGCDVYLLFEEDDSIIKNELITAFRVDDLSATDMVQIAAFKRVIKNYLKMEMIALDK